MLAVGIVGQVMIERHAQSSVRAELVTSGSVFDRIRALRASSLADSADVLARDFGFRAAVASGDQATILSALANLRQRVGVPYAFVVTQDGDVIGGASETLRRTVGTIPYKLAAGRHDATVTSGRAVYRVVVSPILAPTEIGWVVFAVPLDEGEMQALEKLSAIPLTATILRHDGTGWVPATGGLRLPAGAVDRFMGADGSHQDRPALIRTSEGSAIALARPLASTSDRPEAMLLLTYPLAKALAPYRSLQIGIVLSGLIGLILVLWGSDRLAGSIARPIVALDDAARALEEGSRAEVTVIGHDEIGRLAVSFNRMSAGIVERENRIAHLAFHDTLTGLPNRVLFRQQLDAALGRAVRLGEQVAVLCLDLDGFKIVNDSFGHPTGDALLRVVGEIVSARATDGIVARLSGDEFAIVLPRFEGDRPRALAQSIIDAFREPVMVSGHSILTGCSIGIAVAPGDGDDPSGLLKNADLALYRAKQDGRGVFRFFEPGLDAAARRRRQIELDLREALHKGQFRLDYQPIFDLKADRICGFEALMRWDHPTRGLVSPVEFIPVAEESGLIVAMGEWALHEACREAQRWPEDMRIAVNVSAIQFRNSGFANIVVQALSRSGLDPRRLEIEITESVFLEGSGPTLDLLHRLRALGIRIALDDFGTGYSSLSYLRSFPFDKIKIDRSFVAPIAGDASAAAIVRAIVDLAGAFHMETTAEGVEDPEQLAALRSQGCSSIQGYLFSRPLTVEGVRKLLQDQGMKRTPELDPVPIERVFAEPPKPLSAPLQAAGR
ncbi:EAL domain-containing protein [Sphingomonas sp. CGMCC 1.13654]|uniref:EAL domain-containing protein n=2 Tax=Sphingomonas chungangi TaxID=2683589 RepID=A0A838L648_9SPHN|nr:EAL domain-containing protein [Sphingomonas chungangi]MVW57143.1 EAL domain-containing protein [Sphingomonas chungangi]